MKNKYFTALDGTTYITKSHIKEVIQKTLEEETPSRSKYAVQRFADQIIKSLEACHYREQTPDMLREGKL